MSEKVDAVNIKVGADGVEATASSMGMLARAMNALSDSMEKAGKSSTPAGGSSTDSLVSFAKVAMIAEAGKAVGQFAQSANAARADFARGSITTGEYYKQVAEGIPVIGEFVKAGSAIREMFTGEKLAIDLTIESAKRWDILSQQMREDAEKLRLTFRGTAQEQLAMAFEIGNIGHKGSGSRQAQIEREAALAEQNIQNAKEDNRKAEERKYVDMSKQYQDEKTTLSTEIDRNLYERYKQIGSVVIGEGGEAIAKDSSVNDPYRRYKEIEDYIAAQKKLKDSNITNFDKAQDGRLPGVREKKQKSLDNELKSELARENDERRRDLDSRLSIANTQKLLANREFLAAERAQINAEYARRATDIDLRYKELAKDAALDPKMMADQKSKEFGAMGGERNSKLAIADQQANRNLTDSSYQYQVSALREMGALGSVMATREAARLEILQKERLARRELNDMLKAANAVGDNRAAANITNSMGMLDQQTALRMSLLAMPGAYHPGTAATLESNRVTGAGYSNPATDIAMKTQQYVAQISISITELLKQGWADTPVLSGG